jgi:putative ABC transport system substrate-binding protein
MKKFLLIPICASLLLVSYYIQKPKSDRGAYRIAILTPVTHAALQDIIAGFKDTLGKKLDCVFDVYNAHGDRVLLRTQAEKIAQDPHYNLALVVATQPSIVMKEVITQRQSDLPIVCTAVDDPVKIGLVQSLDNSGNNFTTVTESMDPSHYDQQIAHICQLFPQLKKLLLVYSPNVMLDREKELLATSCAKQGLSLTILPIYATHELAQKAGLLIPEHDGVIILKDNTIVSCVQTLVNLCHRHQLPLCVSDLNSLAAGAACAYGVQEAEFGIAAAHKAYAILHDKQKPSEVASSNVGKCVFEVNQTVLNMLNQGSTHA